MKAIILISTVCGFLANCASARQVEQIDDSMKELQGKWAYRLVVQDDRKTEKADLEEFFCLFQGDEFTLRVAEITTMHGKYRLDSHQIRPRTIDLHPTDKAHKGKVYRGIFKLGGKQLFICYGASGQERPTDFTATSGSGRTLLVLQKV